MNLIIVESPTKAKTLQGFLGKDYKILSSYGHVRDLPKSSLGVDVENNFNPKYTIAQKAKKNLSLLKKETADSDLVLLGTDPDREGEAIAWHLAQALNLKEKGEKGKGVPYQRVAFHEITRNAIEEALKNPRHIDINLVDSQQARRVLDRIVGYKLSPFLWKKVAKGLSAGRVQSVAVRLIVDREKEIQKFIPEEYWEIEALLKNTKNEPLKEFKARLIQVDGKPVEKMDIKSESQALSITNSLENAAYHVLTLEKKETKKRPLPPFTTSTLQQGSWKKFRMSSKFTMRTAQQLYEMGLITYHRTDSLNLSEQALGQAKDFIISSYGENYWNGQLTRYKTKAKLAQEAHEAIRPTFCANVPEKAKEEKKLNNVQFKIYELIWKRFVACQMAPAIFDAVSADIKAQGKDKDCLFRATGQTLKFEGFLKVYPSKFEEVDLPQIEAQELLELINLEPNQHFTKPPARYNEASLVKALEQNGVGRPSTYASIISTIQERNYIERDEKKHFIPTEVGVLVNDLLVDHFNSIVDINFTARMEEDLDDIAEGKKEWVKVLKDFYLPFSQNLEHKYEEVAKKNSVVETNGEPCPKCGAPLVTKFGRFGKFIACSNFPECKFTKNLKQTDLGIKCPKCQSGEVVEKRSKRGKIFYGCSNYPNCDFALWNKPILDKDTETVKKCLECDSILYEDKKGNEVCPNKMCKTNG